MTPDNEYWIEVDKDGRLVLPGEVAEHCLPQACGGLRPLAVYLVRWLQLVGGERGGLLRANAFPTCGGCLWALGVIQCS